MTEPAKTDSRPEPKTDSSRADAKKTVRVAMQEYLRRGSVLPVLRMLLDLLFLGACIAGACYFTQW